MEGDVRRLWLAIIVLCCAWCVVTAGQIKFFGSAGVTTGWAENPRFEGTANGPIDRVYDVDLVDDAGVSHASVAKTIYIRRNDRETSSVQRANAPRNR